MNMPFASILWRTFASILWLDDVRCPDFHPAITWVKNYDQFVNYLLTQPMPELICFDHDLAPEHYPGAPIPEEPCTEPDGDDCARFIVENNLPLQYWSVHSYNPDGRKDIETRLRNYRPEGEVRGLKIPFTIVWGGV